MKNDSIKHCKDYGEKLKPHKNGSIVLYKIYAYTEPRIDVCTHKEL